MYKSISKDSIEAMININSNIYTKIIGTNIEELSGEHKKSAEFFNLLSFYNDNIFVVERWLDKLYPERFESKESIKLTRARRLFFETVKTNDRIFTELREEVRN
jgi:hypothetical protein|tara:strand:+ start:611 stop:922 length:312 start_codon:yes stop_codon:yes gene_type:complete